MSNDVTISITNVIKVVLIVVLAIFFACIGAMWLRSTPFYAELGEKKSFQAFLLMFFSAGWSATAAINILFQFVSRKKD